MKKTVPLAIIYRDSETLIAIPEDIMVGCDIYQHTLSTFDFYSGNHTHHGLRHNIYPFTTKKERDEFVKTVNEVNKL